MSAPTPRSAVRPVAGLGPLLGVLFCALSLGCGDRPQPSEPAPTPAGGITLTDDAGRTVRLAGPAQRVLSLAPSHTELVFALGAGERLVGRTPACDHPAAAAAVPAVGNLFPPDYERIVGAAPDLVLMLDGQVDVRRRLEGQGLTVAVVQPRGLADVADAMRTIGALLGVDGASLAARFEADLAAATRSAAADAPRVFYEVGMDPLFGAGPGGFIGDLIRRAGARNALGGEAEWPRVSTEQLIAGAPDLIVVGSAERRTRIMAEPPPGWTALPAVKRGRIAAVPDPDIFNRPGPRVLDALRWLAAEVAR